MLFYKKKKVKIRNKCCLIFRAGFGGDEDGCGSDPWKKREKESANAKEKKGWKININFEFLMRIILKINEINWKLWAADMY